MLEKLNYLLILILSQSEISKVLVITAVVPEQPAHTKDTLRHNTISNYFT